MRKIISKQLQVGRRYLFEMVRGYQTTAHHCIWNKFSVHETSSCIVEVSPGFSTRLLWGSIHSPAKGLLERWEAPEQAPHKDLLQRRDSKTKSTILLYIQGEMQMTTEGRVTERKNI